MTRPKFEIVITTAGAVSIRNNVLNETMHNPVGPWAEANALYVEQSRLAERLSESGRIDELTLFDVGLGAAANALAALHCAKLLRSPKRRLRIVSFERDLELLRFALANSERFAHFAGFETAIESLLANGIWESVDCIWELREGDILERLPLEPHRADLIYFDPYSPKVNQDAWSVECFTLLRAKAKNPDVGGAILYTYSQATPARVALFRAGFFVGRGRATGLKEETTQASTRLLDLDDPLGPEWLARWRRSGAKRPYAAPNGSSNERSFEEAEIEQFLSQHTQLLSLGAL